MSKFNMLFNNILFVSILFSCTFATNEKAESKTIQSDISEINIDNIVLFDPSISIANW